VSQPAPVPIDRKGIALFAVPMAVLTILGWIGDALMPTLLADAPLLLLVCNPRLRNLILVSPTVEFLPFVTVAVARLVVSDPLFYWFGKRYGDVAIRWMEQRLGPGAGPVLWFERAFRKAAYPMVALMPNNWICLLAGATGMIWWRFAVVNFTGTLARILAIRMLGDAFSDPLLTATDWISDNRWWLTLVTVAIVFIVILHSVRRGRSELDTPAELAAELERAAESEPEVP
jgi:membrane protein DedA with SNARE-associated domain